MIDSNKELQLVMLIRAFSKWLKLPKMDFDSDVLDEFFIILKWILYPKD